MRTHSKSRTTPRLAARKPGFVKNTQLMNKNDWTILFVRVVGLYLVVTHLATFATTAASLAIALTQAVDRRQVAIYLWQGPVVSALVLAIGLLLIFKASTISAIIQKNDKT